MSDIRQLILGTISTGTATGPQCNAVFCDHHLLHHPPRLHQVTQSGC